MEDAVDALKIGFAVLVFVIAITVTFSLISQAKSTADVVLFYADETNFYKYEDSAKTNRTVDVAEVISALYRACKESVSVTIDINGKELEFDLTTLNANTNEIEVELKYISTKLLELPSDSKFLEEFVEVPISGTYVTGEDSTTLTLNRGGKKVYVKYILQKKSE